MKKTLVLLLSICIMTASYSQGRKYEKEEAEKEEVKGFKKENLFTGGNLQLAFGNNTTQLGVGPFFGYSINRYVDVAASVNVNYVSQRDNIQFDDKLRQTTIGPGAFVRVFPINIIFAQVQYEHNFIKQRYKSPPNQNQPDQTGSIDVNSVLVGGGLATGRNQYNKSFFYFSVLWDVSRVQGSPYTDGANRAVPIIRTGYNIALFQGRN